MQYLELLSPAKNLECGKAAIDHGADAVYIGASRFGARAAAGNTTEDIAELCDYAHQFDAKVYVTVNTIVYDNEINDTLQLCRQLQTVGVDAILVQDMGLMDRLNNDSSDTTLKTALHASTQTDNRTAEKVRWLASLGFKRVVLARELSVTEIAEIHRRVPEVELEVFVHGALCVSYSGQCYASEYCFQRSANRGECAQFCRMPMNLTDADGKTIERGRHLLSLKDMAQLDNLERLAEAGAVSFKIEGRLKDVDYVKNVTAAYSQALDNICRRNPDRYRRAAMGHAAYTFTPDIRKSFNRGFTTYFADGKNTDGDNRQLASFDTPKAQGEPVGRVKEIRGRSFNVASMEAFANGDGLCFFNAAGQLVGFRVNKAEGNRLFPLTMPKELHPGMQLYRNHDQAFEALLAKPSAERKVKVSMLLNVSGDTIALTITDEHGNQRSASMACQVQTAQKPQDDNIRKQLAKLGGTPFVADNITIQSDVDSPFIPSSMLAALRRATLEAERTNGHHATTGVAADNGTYNGVEHGATAPLYPIPYLYNAANEFAKDFYARHGVEVAKAFGSDSQLLMQCRYCLRNELGYCTKSGRKAPWREPLTLSLDDGKEFTLKFNCRKCEMEVWAKQRPMK